MKDFRTVFLFTLIFGCGFISAFAGNSTYNVALNKPVTASTSTATEPAVRAVDGDTTTNWCATGYVGWIKVDLQSPFTVDSLKLYVNQYYAGNTVHEVKVSEDMVTWKLVQTLTGYTKNNQLITLRFSQPLADVRGIMLNTTTSNSWVAWYEIQAFAALSKPKITQEGSVLSSNSTINNQWYLNGSPIQGATSQVYTATVSGTYQVKVTDGHGSESMSDNLVVTIGTGVKNALLRDVTVYPNPAKDNVFVDGVTTGKIELFNLQGQLVRNLNVSDIKTSLDVSKLADGVYSMKITTKDGIVVRKIVKD